MENNLENSNKILKTFSTIRCLNRDQLPRYLDGRLTDVEKHLVEQHLVDCDLCYDALHVLQQPQYRDKYQSLSVSIQQYIRNSIKQVSHIQKAERYQRKEQKKESLLIYFWIVAAIAIFAGGIYLVQQGNRFRSLSSKPLASSGSVPTIQASNREEVKQQSVSSLPVPRPDTAVGQAGIVTPSPVPVKESSVKPVVKKDTLKAAPVVSKPEVKTDDTTVKKPVVPVKPPEDKEEKKATPVVVQKDSPRVVKEKKADTPEAKIVPKDTHKDDDDKKPAPSAPTSTDEFLYKAAMVYHQQGDLNEAISRYKHLSTSNSKYGELARYQLAVCYRSKGQTGKARRMFKEVVNMGGSMKDKAQAALDNL
ncbi:Transmembrane transcriptional regulator (anti-sigma factor RsiW) [Chitinophaga sp. CF118]|uniref:tetratricopeptide repeat protein n=1 Tax=Chitinophaga sp. CF118 TaxID=1884367 RepID=UPI0008E89EDC|nr:tetratricopeptide repeat protein [Chitinophaga sp. CF118]SFD52260.1 Transmembrane transcriptional regulator (anti-sigma factor RsiW) [Chitinophaga sp. CF118]